MLMRLMEGVEDIPHPVLLAGVRQFFAIVLGVVIAWLIARSNLPGRGWMEVGFWVALFGDGRALHDRVAHTRVVRE